MATLTLTSSDQTVTVEIKAGWGGVKSIQLISPPFPPKFVTQQQLIDIVKTCIINWFANPPAET